MRPSSCFFLILLFFLALDGWLFLSWQHGRIGHATAVRKQQEVVATLGLTDLCVATEARYTRHPAVSDAMAPFMDHPGAFEHFPSGSFWTPVRSPHSGN